MRKYLPLFLLAGVAFLWGIPYTEGNTTPKAAITDVYTLRMNIQTPRIYDNMTSQGYRKYTLDVLEGDLRITYPLDESERATVEVVNLVNKRYRVGGKNVTYITYVDESIIPRVNVIGDNKKSEFKVPSIVFALECDPSYNIGEVEEDNTLYITLGGKGSTRMATSGRGRRVQVINRMSGNLAGSLGCGCKAYGHVSPTRVNGAYGPIKTRVDDVAAVYGTWTARLRTSIVVAY